MQSPSAGTTWMMHPSCRTFHKTFPISSCRYCFQLDRGKEGAPTGVETRAFAPSWCATNAAPIRIRALIAGRCTEEAIAPARSKCCQAVGRSCWPSAGREGCRCCVARSTSRGGFHLAAVADTIRFQQRVRGDQRLPTRRLSFRHASAPPDAMPKAANDDAVIAPECGSQHSYRSI